MTASRVSPDAGLHDRNHQFHPVEAAIDRIQTVDDVYADAVGLEPAHDFRHRFSAGGRVAPPGLRRGPNVRTCAPGKQKRVGRALLQEERRLVHAHGWTACAQLGREPFVLHARGEQAEAVGEVAAHRRPDLRPPGGAQQVGQPRKELGRQARETLDGPLGPVQPSQELRQVVLIAWRGQQAPHYPVAELRDEAAPAGHTGRAEQIDAFGLAQDLGYRGLKAGAHVGVGVEEVEQQRPASDGCRRQHPHLVQFGGAWPRARPVGQPSPGCQPAGQRVGVDQLLQPQRDSFTQLFVRFPPAQEVPDTVAQRYGTGFGAIVHARIIGAGDRRRLYTAMP